MSRLEFPTERVTMSRAAGARRLCQRYLPRRPPLNAGLALPDITSIDTGGVAPPSCVDWPAPAQGSATQAVAPMTMVQQCLGAAAEGRHSRWRRADVCRIARTSGEGRPVVSVALRPYHTAARSLSTAQFETGPQVLRWHNGRAARVYRFLTASTTLHT